MRLRILFFLSMMLVNAPILLAQKDTTDNYVNKFITIPSIRLNIVPDSSLFTNENLKKDKPFILMFFSPECDHCQMETRELIAYKTELKDIQILMVSGASFKETNDFYNEFRLSDLPNIKVGLDVNFKLGRIYRISTYPSIFVYDNNGTLAKAFVGNIGVQAILDAVK